MIRRFLTFAGIGLAAVLAEAASAHAEPLAAAVSRAIASHPQIGVFDFNRKAARSAVTAAEGLDSPKLSMSAQAGYTGNEDAGASSSGISGSAVQTLYDGGEFRAQLKRSKADALAADRRLEDVALETALQTVQSYIEVQRSRRLIGILKQNLSTMGAIASRVKQRINAGLGTQADLYQARSRIEAARQQLETAKQQNADAVASYLALTGERPGTLETEGAPRKALPKSVEDAVDLSRRYSPKIIATAYDALAADATAEAAASQLRPRLNLQMNLNYDSEVSGISAENQSATAMVVLKVDLYDGGVRKARLAQARYQAQSRQESVKAMTRDIERQMRTSWNAINGSIGRLGPLQRHTRDARQSLNLSLERFGAGLTTLDTILNLQDEVALAEVNYINEQSSYRFNVYRVLAATGRLWPALGIDFAAMVAAR